MGTILKQWVTKMGRRSYLVALGAGVLAIGGIVLMRAPTQARIDDTIVPPIGPSGPTTVTATGPGVVNFNGPALSGHTALSQTAVFGTGQQTVLAEVNLNAANVEGATQRSPVAIGIVLDVSGSMAGEKIEQARNSVRQLIENMEPTDQVAVVTYNHSPSIRQGLAPVSSVLQNINAITGSIQASGGTMIPQALELGAGALAQAPSNFVKRVVLISDGIDGSGIGAHIVRTNVQTHAGRGMAFSTLGIGADYQEAFLTNVADAGNGNYAFLATGSELQPFLQQELAHASQTVVDGVVATFQMPPGWVVSRGFGLTPQTNGQTVEVPMGQLAAGQNRKAVIELTGPSGPVGDVRTIGFGIRYRTTADTETHQIVDHHLALTTVESPTLADASRNPETYARTQAVALDYDQRESIAAWQRGDQQAARRIAVGNRARLGQLTAEAPASVMAELRRQEAALEADLEAIDAVAPSSLEGRNFQRRSNAGARTRAW